MDSSNAGQQGSASQVSSSQGQLPLLQQDPCGAGFVAIARWVALWKGCNATLLVFNASSLPYKASRTEPKHCQAAVQVLWASLHPASIGVPAAASFECAFLRTVAGSSRACSHNPAASSQHACRLQHQQHGNPAASAVTIAPATATVQSWTTCPQLELQPHVRLAPAAAAAAASKAVQLHHTAAAADMALQLVHLMMQRGKEYVGRHLSAVAQQAVLTMLAVMQKKTKKKPGLVAVTPAAVTRSLKLGTQQQLR
jgi:hypothetical protein